MLLRERVGARAAGGRGRRWRGASATPRRAASTGPTTTTRRWRGCCRAVARAAARRADRADLRSVGAGARRARRRSSASWTWWSACAARRTTSCSTRSSGRLSLIEHRFLADEDRAAFGALVTRAVRRARRRSSAGRRRAARTTRPACAARCCCARSVADRARIRTRSPRPRSACRRRPDRRPEHRRPEPAGRRRHRRRPPRRRRRASKICARGREVRDRSGRQAPLPARARPRRGSARCPPAPSSWR